MNELQNLATFVSEIKLENVPKEVVAAAKMCILDTLSTALGGVTNSMFQSIKEVYLKTEKDGNGGISLWGDKREASLRTVTFLNGMSGHILELDDVHINSKTHIGTVVIPAAWTLAQYLQKSGNDLIEAVICGYEVMARIGMGFGVSSHRNLGWHVTGTAGTFGSAAACGKLLGFTPAQMTAAFGLAGTQSCSTWAFLSDGATNKILHPGRAAVSGLESCLLVKGGMRGSAHILDAEDGGIFPMMSREYDYSMVDKDLGAVYEILNVDKKPYPCCRSTHCAIEGALNLRKTYHIDPETIDHVEVYTYLVGLKQCGLSNSSKEPHAATEAKFSTPYLVATAFLTGKVGLSDFEQAKINNTKRQELLKKVVIKEDPIFTERYPHHWGCRVEVTLKNGCTYSQEIKDASGSVTAPLTPEQMTAKALSCCEIYHSEQVKELVYTLLNLESCSVLPDLSALKPVTQP
ncbi:MmgE/PrpD family protein [Brotaphodocola sp.]|uniref:MmgE/PrpD family protein n=1 Tax=Brotaphodocola sp. TaxID=3073577 RepID=UPI003D7DD2D2